MLASAPNPPPVLMPTGVILRRALTRHRLYDRLMPCEFGVGGDAMRDASIQWLNRGLERHHDGIARYKGPVEFELIPDLLTAAQCSTHVSVRRARGASG
jgi:hypothetical protein